MKKSILEKIYPLLSGYNDKTYWHYADRLNSPSTPFILRYWYLYRMKKMEVRNGASIGFKIRGGVQFDAPPILKHGLKGIVITPDVKLGKNVIIYHQVTIGMKNPDDTRGAVIGDNVLIGAGAKILGAVHIGNNVRIGANAVVTTDIPDNAIVYVQSTVIQK